MDYRRKIDRRDSLMRVATMLIGIALNCALAFAATRLRFPLYLDTIGTIGVTLLAGMCPGILTGVLTNVLCSVFDANALYFSLISALIAILTALYDRRKGQEKAGATVVLILLLALVGSVLGTAFQYLLIGSSRIETAARVWQEAPGGAGAFFASMLKNTGVNVIDKALSVLLALLALKLIPRRTKERIHNSIWLQEPLSDEKAAALSRHKGHRSISARIGLTLLSVAVILAIALGWISINLYNRNIKKEYAENALHATRLASKVIDADSFDEYIRDGKGVPGYRETEEMLYSIRENSQGVIYMGALQIRDDGCHVVFDLDTPDVPAYQPGDVVPFEAAYEPYLPALFAGDEIPAIESDDISGWVLTAYYPIRNGAGKTVAYACADVSMVYLSDYVKDFIVKSLLMFSGLFLAIVGYGLWVSRYTLVYPIGSMTDCTRDFALGDADQASIDNKVRSLRSLDIRTGDEVEQLYQAICKMSVDMTDQVRSIRHYAENAANMQNGLIVTMADMVESRDSDTGAHIQKTAEYVKIILDGLRRKGYYPEKLTDKFVSDTVMSAPLHDVGKINISDTILNKPGRLTDEEFAIMKTHTTSGRAIIERAMSTVQGESYLMEARNMAACHHERWDGRGYPEGLHGEAIPLSARVMAVADVFDALTSRRVYKPAFPIEKAVEILREGAGTQFDPKCVEVFLDSIELARSAMLKYQDEAGQEGR